MKPKLRLASFSVMLLSVLTLTGTMLLTGCAGDLVSEADEQGTTTVQTREQTDSKLRFGHLLDRTKSNYVQNTDGSFSKRGGKGKGNGGGTTPPPPTTVSLVIGIDDAVLDMDRVVRRHRLIRRHEYDEVFYGLAAEIDQARLDSFLAAVELDPDITWVEPDIFIIPESGENAEELTRDQVIPWGIDRIGATHSSTLSGNHQDSVDVDLYILDTGVKEKDLAVVEQLKFFPEDDGTSSATDQNGHGTHIAGTAAAHDDLYDVVGVAPGARIHSFKVLDDNGNTETSNVIAAVDFLTKRKLANPSQPMVVNMSFGADIGTTEYNALDRAIQASIQAGVIYVISAGNDGINAETVTPAHVEEAITVGAYNAAHHFLNFSNYGPVVDLLAPGSDILSISIQPPKGRRSRLELMSGTSQAAPHVAGAAALYVSQHPNAHPHQVRNALVQAARTNVQRVPGGTTNKSLWVADF